MQMYAVPLEAVGLTKLSGLAQLIAADFAERHPLTEEQMEFLEQRIVKRTQEHLLISRSASLGKS